MNIYMIAAFGGSYAPDMMYIYIIIRNIYNMVEYVYVQIRNIYNNYIHAGFYVVNFCFSAWTGASKSIATETVKWMKLGATIVGRTD